MATLTPPPSRASLDSSDEDEPSDWNTRQSEDVMGSPVAAGKRLEELALDRARRNYSEEDPSSPGWALHKKHVFVLSSAGKPIFSRYGDESLLAPQMGLLQALISFVQDRGDTIRYIRAGNVNIVFVLRNALYLVAVSSTGETVEHLWRQLGLLHSQIISILTAKVDQIFQKNPSFDARGLLGGTDRVTRALLHSAGSDPAMLLQAAPCLRMAPPVRAELGRLLSACRPPELLFGVFLAHNHLVTLSRPKRSALHADDLLLIMNTVASSASFRDNEAWLPICLPRFNASGFLYAHISYVAPELCLVLLTPKADGFASCSECRTQVAQRLSTPDELRDALLYSLAQPQYALDELGVPEVRHFIYRLPGGGAHGLDLFSAPRTGRLAGTQSPYHDQRAVKRLMRHYMLAHARVHQQPGRPLREYYQATDDEMIVVWSFADFELYVAFSPLVAKSVANTACYKLHRRLKKEQPNLFMLNPTLK